MNPGRRTWPIYDAVSVHMVSHRLYQPTWHPYISHLYTLNGATNDEIIFELGYLTKNEKKTTRIYCTSIFKLRHSHKSARRERDVRARSLARVSLISFCPIALTTITYYYFGTCDVRLPQYSRSIIRHHRPYSPCRYPEFFHRGYSSAVKIVPAQRHQRPRSRSCSAHIFHVSCSQRPFCLLYWNKRGRVLFVANERVITKKTYVLIYENTIIF